jgi:hypothetical protein
MVDHWLVPLHLSHSSENHLVETFCLALNALCVLGMLTNLLGTSTWEHCADKLIALQWCTQTNTISLEGYSSLTGVAWLSIWLQIFLRSVGAAVWLLFWALLYPANLPKLLILVRHAHDKLCCQQAILLSIYGWALLVQVAGKYRGMNCTKEVALPASYAYCYYMGPRGTLLITACHLPSQDHILKSSYPGTIASPPVAAVRNLYIWRRMCNTHSWE